MPRGCGIWSHGNLSNIAPNCKRCARQRKNLSSCSRPACGPYLMSTSRTALNPTKPIGKNHGPQAGRLHEAAHALRRRRAALRYRRHATTPSRRRRAACCTTNSKTSLIPCAPPALLRPFPASGAAAWRRWSRGLLRQLNRPMLLVCGHLDEAEDLADDVELFSGNTAGHSARAGIGRQPGTGFSEEQVSNRLRLIARLASAAKELDRFGRSDRVDSGADAIGAVPASSWDNSSFRCVPGKSWRRKS